MKISIFTIIKNEVDYVGYCIMSILPYVDEIVFADGNSTDGSVELVKHIQKKYDIFKKIKLFEHKDCKNLQKDYVRLFNWTLNQCRSDYVWFLHPDMVVLNPEKIKQVNGSASRYNVNMISLAEGNKIISEGRTNKWATIYKNSYGLHFYGYYGAENEDFYFKDFTGDEHIFYKHFQWIPYEIKDTDIKILHYCDTKPYNKRYDRMVKILLNNNVSKIDAVEIAKNHPRVILKDGVFENIRFKFIKNRMKQPEIFNKYKYFQKFKKEN